MVNSLISRRPMPEKKPPKNNYNREKKRKKEKKKKKVYNYIKSISFIESDAT